MLRFVSRATSALVVLLLVPAAAYAQAAITGVARDQSGGVLPGVTVEAASPVLIEKVRSVATDGTGQYRIVNLLPGTYSVTFSLPGFSTVKRDGIELTGDFVATVNGDLKVGAIEDQITVTGESPIVDVQSAKVQQTVSKDVLAAIPSSRNAAGIQALVPGMSTNSDSGGINGGMTGGAGSIHGGRGNDSRTYSDGNNTGWAGGSAGGGNTPNVSGAQEVVLSTSGGLGEAETSGVILNVIPRDGGNTFSGQFSASGANDAMQGSNYTQKLKDAGLKTPSELLKVYDINPMGGGRIIRDKLWFYLTYRQTGGERTVPGMWINKNAGNPNAWTVDFDRTKPAFDDNLERNGIGRLTWQISPRNKVSAHWSEQYTASSIKGGGTGTTTPEASTYTLFQPSHINSASYSAPLTSRLLIEAGWGTYQSRYRNPGPRVDGTFNPRMIRVNEQAGEIPGLSSRMPSGVGGGFNHHLIGALANLRASTSYVTGAHNMKFGYQGGFGNPSQTYTYFNEVILIRMQNGVPNRLTQVVSNDHTNIKIVRNLIPTSFYGQDQWTTGRLTLQGGVRYDHLLTTYPDSFFGGPGYNASAPTLIDYPSRSTQGVSWNDVSVRTGAAYDLFGTGKTALKFNLGKYMEAFSATNTDLDLNPLIRNTISTTRTWTDTNKDFVPNCDLANKEKNGECAAMDNKNLGTANFTRSYDPNFVTGSGVRPYNWGLGLSVQQEVLPRVSVNVGYFRNWWGNWYAVDNRSTTLADYTPFSIVAPVDSRLPGGGGQTISGLYNLAPGKVGAVDELAQSASNFAKLQENWQGVDVNVVARLRSGLTLQGGTSTGRRLEDACAMKAALPEYGTGPNGGNTSIAGTQTQTNPYCRIVEPYTTQIRGLATYAIPVVGLQVSGTWSSTPGSDLAANYTVTSAIANVGPQPLGRNLSAGNVTVNLIQPQTFFADRRNNLDFRVAKILRYGRTRTQIGVDIYNATNTDVVTTYNQTFTSTSWLTPTAIQPARYIKVSGQFDF
ncbi:MAG TPA: carboxypeptidase-like regulatory domain-containing protein [Vicinamibacterales bacterium]